MIRMVPTGTEKPGKTGEHFPVRQKSGNFDKTGKVREFYSKYWKNEKFNQLTTLGKLECLSPICPQIFLALLC